MAAFPTFPRAANAQSDPGLSISRSAPEAAVDAGAVIPSWTGMQPRINFVSIGPVVEFVEGVSVADSISLTPALGRSEAITITDSGVVFSVGGGPSDNVTISESLTTVHTVVSVVNNAGANRAIVN